MCYKRCFTGRCLFVNENILKTPLCFYKLIRSIALSLCVVLRKITLPQKLNTNIRAKKILPNEYKYTNCRWKRELKIATKRPTFSKSFSSKSFHMQMVQREVLALKLPHMTHP